MRETCLACWRSRDFFGSLWLRGRWGTRVGFGLWWGMHLVALLQILGMITLANSVPLIAKNILGDRFSWPLDFGVTLGDGRPMLGRSKTIRGLVLAVFVSWLAAPLIGLGSLMGAGIGALAMAGDLLSSFLKRRLGQAASSQAVGLDQVPESLLPLLACVGGFELTLADVAVGVLVFLVGELLVSRLLFRLHLRDRPY
jgi:CDP-diglyceride synthetase